MQKVNRVAVIEVGSRAVRLLVADVSRESGLQVVGTDWKETGLAEGLDIGGSEAEVRLNQVNGTLGRFCVRAREFQPTRIAAFGTEAIRRVEAKGVERLREICPDFRVLSRKEEAELSFLTGVMGVPQEDGVKQDSLVIDQGSGSMEVIVGTAQATKVRVDDSRSYRLGTRELVKILQEKGNLPGLRKTLVKRFAEYQPLMELLTGRPIILGSAATKIAWIKASQNSNARYDPRQVHGCVITVNEVVAFTGIAVVDPKTARQWIDPRNPESGEFETVVSGLVALEVFLKREKKEDFVVCAHGTRYGFAWKLGFEKPERTGPEL